MSWQRGGTAKTAAPLLRVFHRAQIERAARFGVLFADCLLFAERLISEASPAVDITLPRLRVCKKEL